jgi:hypothetical protein
MALSAFTALLGAITIGLTLCFYSTTLTHVCRGSKYKFVITLIVMLVISNLAEFMIDYVNILIY